MRRTCGHTFRIKKEKGQKSAVCPRCEADVPIPNKRQILASWVVEIRFDLYSEHGGTLLASLMDVPVREWVAYEEEETMPGEVLLRFIDQTRVRMKWLLTGEGQKYEPKFIR